MKHIDKDEWVEDTLKSLDGIQQPQTPDGLFENAMRRVAFGRARMIRMPAAQVWSAAACGLVLVMANLFICQDFFQSDDHVTGSKERFAKEYFGADVLKF